MVKPKSEALVWSSNTRVEWIPHMQGPGNSDVELVASNNNMGCQDDVWKSCRRDVRSKAHCKEHLHGNLQSMHGSVSCDI